MTHTHCDIHIRNVLSKYTQPHSPTLQHEHNRSIRTRPESFVASLSPGEPISSPLIIRLMNTMRTLTAHSGIAWTAARARRFLAILRAGGVRLVATCVTRHSLRWLHAAPPYTPHLCGLREVPERRSPSKPSHQTSLTNRPPQAFPQRPYGDLNIGSHSPHIKEINKSST
jgi:hypothetical protein